MTLMNWLRPLMRRVSLTAIGVALSAAGAATSEPLNVLFIAVDDLRPQLGCYGDSVARTPHLDRLARRGTLFDRAYCQQAVCNPSRASIMTGRRPDSIRVWDLETHFRKTVPDVVTLPQYFKRHGYHAQAIGKIYHDPAWAQDAPSWSAPEILTVTGTRGKYVLEDSKPPTGRGKGKATERADVPDDAYIDGQVAEAAVRFLRRARERPFFLAVGFRRPHLPFSVPEKYWAMYDRASLPMPDPPRAPESAPPVALHDSVELRGYTDVPTTGPISPDRMRELIHGYYAGISFIDAQIGKVLKELDRQRLTTNTLVVVWSDHGYHLGEKGLWCKTTNYELDTRVPLIIAWPGQRRPGTRTESLVELLDLYPTLADLAGLPAPAEVEGVSLRPLLEDPAATVKEAAFSQFPRPMKRPEVMGYSVRTRHYRYTEWRSLADGKVTARELYDHRTDPAELRNLAGEEDSAGTMSRLSALLRDTGP